MAASVMVMASDNEKVISTLFNLFKDLVDDQSMPQAGFYFACHPSLLKQFNGLF